MPEGHTLHRLAEDLSRDLSGHRLLVSSPQGRFANAESLNDRVLRKTEAVGKHLFLHFAGPTSKAARASVVHVHLGLFGKFYRRSNPAPAPRETTRLRLIGPSITWDLVGPTRAEILPPSALRDLRARLGADPLDANADPDRAWTIFHKTKRPVGAVLLDQRVLSGIGNVYRAEILFLLGIHPETPACDLRRAKFDAIWKLSRELLTRGVKEKRIVTVPHVPGKRVKRADALHVYRRSACRKCEGAVTKATIGARPMYFCARCQPPTTKA